MLRKLLLILSVFITSLALAQPANDNCSGALNLGTLGSPGPCGTLLQNGATTTIAGTNVAATPENPYVVLGGCNMASPANSVWYRFTAPVDGYGVVVNITGATFATPNIALYNGSNCNNLVGISCIVGAAGTATLNVQSGIVPGQVYYIQVSGDTGDEGTFTLNVNAYQDCSDCMNASTLTVSPLPVNGTYLPGQAVTFCFHISEWTQVQNNWLHGVQLSFGSGWDLTTLTTTPSPTVLSNWNFVWWAGLPSCGYWQYYPTGITSSVSGAWPPGFYFNGTYSNSGNSCLSAADGNPGNNFGDGFGCSGCTITTFPNEWTFCWTVNVLSGCNPGMSLNMTVNTSGDGESGNWSNPGCLDDPAANFSAIIACCPPNISATSTCVGQSTGTATATPVGSAGPYVYSWAPGGQSTQTATGLTPGTYTVNVTDANLCETSATVSVPSSPIPVVTPISNSSACAGSVLSLPAFASNVAGTTFTWTNSNPAIGLAASGTGNLPSFTATNATLSPLTGIITVTPTGPAPTFCVGLPITFTILVKQFPTVSVAGPNQTFCNTASTHMAGNAPAVGTGVWTLISGAGTFTAPTSPLALVSGLGFGANVFQWTISNSPCPPSSSQVTITNVAPPTVAVAGPNQTVCGTTSATLAGNTALVGTGTWTLVSGAGTITTPSSPTSGITGLGNGANVFQWTITNPPCPPSTSQVTITITPMPVVTVNSPSICLGDVANLTANGATSYAWTAGVATVTANTGTASPLVTTTYTVTGTTGTCSATAIATVTVNPIPVVTVNSPTSCAGQTVNLAPTGATTYTWSAGVSATGDVAPLVTTSYTVTGTTLGCTATAIATVTVNPLPVVTVNSPTICEGQPATLTPNGATSYTWTAGVSGTNTVSPLTTTSYTVTGTTLGCTSTAVATVTVNPLPVVTVNSPTICEGQPATLIPNGATSYTWTAGVSGTNTASPLTTTSYTVTGTTLGCTSTAVSTVTVNPLPVVTVNSPTICEGQTANLVANGAASYSWSAGVSASGDVAPLVTTTYTVTGTSLLGCTASANVTVTVNPLPVVTVNSPTICAGQAATLIPNGATSYTWTAGVSATYTVTPLATTTYTVIGTLLGCSSSAISTVTVNPLPAANVSGGGNACQGNAALPINISFTGSSPWNFSLSDGTSTTALSTTSSPYTIVNPSAGVYSVVAISNNSCSGTATGSASVAFNPNPVVTFTVPIAGCAPVCGTFGSINMVPSTTISSYTWNLGNGTSSNQPSPSTCYTIPGSYSISLTVVSDSGCTYSISSLNAVTVYPSPTASFSFVQPIDMNNSSVQFTDYSIGATSWNWDFGDSNSGASNGSTEENPIHYYGNTGTFCVLLSVSNGYCIDTSQICLEIQPEFSFYIPNAFSPNGDGENDTFFGKGVGIIEYQMDIWDRWGMHLFNCGDINEHWDGKFKGNVVQEDVYVYTVVLKDVFKKEHKYIGKVTVVK